MPLLHHLCPPGIHCHALWSGPPPPPAQGRPAHPAPPPLLPDMDRVLGLDLKTKVRPESREPSSPSSTPSLGTRGMLWPQWLFKEGAVTVTFSSQALDTAVSTVTFQ